MKRILMMTVSFAGLIIVAGSIGATQRHAQRQTQAPGIQAPPGIVVVCPTEDARSEKGLAIAPVPLNFQGRDRRLVGIGSYIVNAQAACNDCHTCPSYAPGHNPFEGGDGQINSANYLAGGVPFGPTIVSANITPDASGKPAGLSFDEYLTLIRTGHDPDDPEEILQVMPWPIFRNMNDIDIRAIYEYLSSIPHAEPGSCGGPGE
ncbi:MAG TPA: cytochrome C [Blastocatellia bacterium]|nr:cytochrome C [Blastocatellia bacterium]